MPTEKSIGSDPPASTPVTAVLLQTETGTGVRWVELPHCGDEDPRVPLETDLSNAAQATC